MIRKLRLKFILINMGIVFIMLSIILGTVVTVTGNALEFESVNKMRTIADNPMLLSAPIDRIDDRRIPYFAFSIDQSGTVTTVVNGNFDLSDDSIVSDLISEALNSSREVGVISEYNVRYLVTKNNIGISIVFTDISSENSVKASMTRIAFAIAILSLGVFFIIIFFLSKWAVNPVEKAWKEQKQFISDVSHELKTPLTVMITNTELLQDKSLSDEQHDNSLKYISQMNERMRGLVESMLELTRSDIDLNEQPKEDIDFSELINDAALPFEPVMFECGHEFEYDIEPNIHIMGNAQYLKQLPEIFFDNARKYAAPDTTVTASLKKIGHKCRFSVSSAGDEISKADLKNIFKRFYRVDKNRTQEGSYGLGLSIAEKIVTQHKGSIWAESSGGINTFIVEFSCIQQ